MSEKRITIRAPKAILHAWLKALRSGEYKQGNEQMHDGRGKYCCLGVLQKVVSGKIKRNGEEELPNSDWLLKHRISFDDNNGFGACDPELPMFNKLASTANDEGFSFSRIADAIEQCSEAI